LGNQSVKFPAGQAPILGFAKSAISTRLAAAEALSSTVITAIGEYFGRDETGGITHNLRTVVIHARGRV
jgi:hypothetical protein